ncbi:MAG: ATP-binding cassette domain-containing protein [Lachnospiraceae bacterium]|jgi:ABC-type dipeptide/oligopeptide/nickel transport system ATPase subunit|nr:ATP-binding cassette domain-containing protein [Lachnospiraceae bacterium]
MKLEAREVSFRYGSGGRRVLDRVSLTVESKEHIGLIAPSGFGKTTLLKLLAGYERPDSGEVLLDGRPLAEFEDYCPVQMIWQHPELSVNPRRRLKTVLLEADWEKEAKDRARIEGELGILDEWKERYPAEVSGGELQRFCIARALGRRTKILLADEITTMLDLVTQGEIWSFLRKELKQREIGLVAVSHSPKLLEKVCSRIVRLD